MDDFIDILDHGLVHGIASNAIWFLMGALVFGVRKYVKFSPTGHTIRYFFTRKKYVLVWNDHNIETSEKIISHLPKIKYLKYIAMNEPENLLRYNLKPRYIHEIILIDSDVTKFSETIKCRKEIQLKLIKYVRKGGLLLGTHDIIYRRCRNDSLQDAFGCKLTTFQRESKPIDVILNEEYNGHPLLEGLPSEFKLDDGEVCWGDWSKDTIFLILSKKCYINKRKPVPILTLRYIGNNGAFIWLNSGDKGDHLSKSVSLPQPEFIRILFNSIVNIKKINEAVSHKK